MESGKMSTIFLTKLPLILTFTLKVYANLFGFFFFSSPSNEQTGNSVSSQLDSKSMETELIDNSFLPFFHVYFFL